MPEAEKLDLLSSLKKDTERIRQKREAQERQWLINIAFLYGIHHFEIEKGRTPSSGDDDRIVWELRNIERKKKQLRVANYILPLFRSMYSKFCMMKSTIDVEALTNNDRDQSAAKVAKEVAEDFWLNCNGTNYRSLAISEVGMQQINAKLFKFYLAMGQGYLIPEFNAKARGTAFLNKNILPDVEIGQVEVKVKHPLDVFVDPYHRWFVYRDRLPLDVISELYDIDDVESEPEEPDSTEQRLLSMLNDGADAATGDIEAANVFTRYEIPSKKHANGRKIVYTGKKVIEESDLPEEYKRRLPLFDFRYLDLLFSPFAQGFVDQLISLQEEYNFTLGQISSYKKMPGKVLNPKGSKLSTKYDPEVGQILTYNSGFKPDYQPGASPPAYLFEDLARIRRDMEDIGSVHDSSIGRVPAGVKSAVGMETLRDQDDSQISPELNTTESKLSMFMDMVLNIMSEKYSEERFLAITGENMAAEVNSFVGSKLIGNKRIKVSLGSALPSSKTARQERILLWKKEGIISPEKAKELLEFGDVEGIWNSLDKQAAKTENLNMIQRPDIEIVAEAWEDHTTHLKVHQDFMKTPNFEKLPPEQRQKIIDHVAKHQEFLSAEAAAAGAMGGAGQPPQGQA